MGEETTCSLEQVVAPISHSYEKGEGMRRLFFVAQDRRRQVKPMHRHVDVGWCWQLVIHRRAPEGVPISHISSIVVK